MYWYSRNTGASDGLAFGRGAGARALIESALRHAPDESAAGTW
jgi:hypothetical protein